MIQLQTLLYLLFILQSSQAIGVLAWGLAPLQRQPLTPEQQCTYIVSTVLIRLPVRCHSVHAVAGLEKYPGDEPNRSFEDPKVVALLSAMRKEQCHKMAVGTLQLKCHENHGLDSDARFAREPFFFSSE